jgi:DNA-binding MarR family transcriptional regulator
MDASPEQCAQEMLEVVPMIMRAIRSQMRSHRTPDLSVPQFRTLNFLGRHQGASLSHVAEHIGLTRPSASKLIDGLVQRGLVSREGSLVDRRRVILGLTNQGGSTLRAARAAAQAELASRLATLPSGEQVSVEQAMRTLRPLFALGTAGRESRQTEITSQGSR